MNMSGIAAAAASQHKKEGEYWLNKLSGELIKSSFPYDHRKTTEIKDKLCLYPFDFSGELYTKLIKLSNGSDARLFMILLAGLNLLLDKYTGNRDIIVGVPIFKQEVEAEFVNTVLTLKNEIHRETTFKELLLQVKDTLFEATENQNYPMETLLYQLGMEEDENGFPLFDVVMLLEKVHDRKYLNQIKTNVVISFDNTGDCIRGSFEYNSSLYEESTIERIVMNFRNLLINALSNVSLKLKEIDILEEDERRQLLIDFNSSQKPYPKYETINSLFEEQVRLTPDSIAVQYEEKWLTYNELNERSNSLAEKLRQKGIGIIQGNNIVALMVERSLEMVVGMLAVLKAGGAYVPIDPEYPLERKQFMLKDSGTNILLINGAIEEIAFDGSILNLDQKELFIGNGSNLEELQDHNRPAYIIYTSGSTGQPKGVLVRHAAIINTLLWRKEFYRFGDMDVILQIPSFSFDSSVEDIFTPLISGSKLLLVNQQERFNITYLQNCIIKHKVTHFLITPGLYKTFMDEDTYFLQSLRVVTVAGDNFNEEFVKEHFSKFANVRLINEYGPTENSVCTTAYEFTPQNTVVLIGKPIHNVKCYIVDPYGCLCPVGFPGELCTSGAGLAEGYLNRPELTLEKFVKNPFEENERMYKTGDLARWLPDGNIEFLGRIDHQVKIRGFRIELGEIESQLLTHEHVRETIVIAKENTDGSKYLVQYFISDTKLAAPELRWCLAEVLPEYMIPSYFVQLDKMPLTPNGKIDRKALPDPNESICLSVEYAEPVGETESRLVEMWKIILNLEKIGVNDNFFEVGGHSLRATQLVSQIRKNLHVDVPLREVFRKPTIRQLAKYIDSREQSNDNSIEAIEEKDYYPTTAAQKRMFLINQAEGIGVTYNVPLSMCIDGVFDLERTSRAFDMLVKRHEAFRTYFDFINDELVQKIQKNVDFKIDYKEAQESELNKLCEEFIRPFDLTLAPLLRVLLVNVKEGKSVLMFDMHHIISDGVSGDILIKEFAELYEGRELPQMRIQYKDFATWQNNLLNGEALKECKEYWTDMFSGELPVLNMPTDYPRPTIYSFEGDKVRFSIDADVTAALKGLANKSKTTIFAVLLGAYNVLLSKYTGQEDIIVGTPIAGRNNADLEGIIGMFINTLALRNQPEGSMAFKDFLSDLGEKTLKAFENQDYPFNSLVDSLKLSRSINRNPLFDTMFVLQNMEFRQSEIEDMKLTIGDLDTKTAKFDIIVMAIERNNVIDFIFEFSTRLYKKETIERMAQHFANILRKVSETPEIQLCSIDMLSEEEKHKLQIQFNDTRTDYPENKTVKQLFEEQAAMLPDKIAVVYGDTSLTYGELDRRADSLAAILQSEGVKKDSIVAILTEKSIEAITAMLAVLKAGGAYLPIDHGYPEDRISYMLEDSGAQLLLSSGVKAFENVSRPSVKMIDITDGSIYSEHVSKIENTAGSDSLAYIMYTSGSTGMPKGVLVKHKNIVRLVKNTNYINLCKEDKLLWTGAIAFDASTFEVWGSLLNGLELHIINDEILINADRLDNVIRANRITTMWLTAPLFNQLVLQNEDIFSPLKNLIVGGDILNPKYINIVRNKYPEINIINGYGPTENTTFSICFTIDKEYEENIPIGKPISNSTAYIVDKYGRLQPIGVPGELWLGGDGVAKGYLNRPELMAEKFIQDTFDCKKEAEDNNKLLYRTGDFARWLPDGNIEFMGRIDNQVKIRGFRVELGEVEEHLLQYEPVKEAVVIVKTDITEGKSLCAYICADRELTVSELKEYLSRELPAYMVPSYFKQLDKLPLTINGKVDKEALLQYDGSMASGVEYTAPDNETEEKLLQIWKEVLGVEVEEISTNDNFFDIGGNSLLIMKVVSKIHSVFDMLEQKITAMTMFQYPTIRLMAKQLDGKGEDGTDSFDEISNRIKKRRRGIRG